MRIIVTVIVYKRLENLKRWLRCWEISNQMGAEFRVIHNYDGDSPDPEYKEICDRHKAVYVPRINVGLDIGAFQDVCRERLEGFDNNWDIMLWAADDTIPMNKNFLEPFVVKLMKPGIGVSCVETSREVYPHIRTTGFCLRKSTAVQITFPADPVIDKKQCYEFEHRGRDKTFLKQILRLGLRAAMISDLKTSSLWDIENRKNLKRWEEHELAFMDDRKVTFIATIFNSYPSIISSLISQTHQDWELILIHDGPNETNLRDIVLKTKDNRIKYIETGERQGSYGHPIRKWALDEVREGNLAKFSSFIVITNSDNQYVPVFCEYILKGFKDSKDSVAVYSDKMVHSYRAWDSQDCRFERGYLDCGGVMVRKEAATAVGWRDTSHHSADWFYFQDIADKYGKDKFSKVKGCLFVHN